MSWGRDETRRTSPDRVFLDLPIEGPLADPEQPGGLLAVAVGELEGLGDVVLLDLLERPADRCAGAEPASAGAARGGGLEVLGEVVEVETPSESITTMLSIVFSARGRCPARSGHQGLAGGGEIVGSGLPCAAEKSLRK
jgi:hypothetical protein